MSGSLEVDLDERPERPPSAGGSGPGRRLVLPLTALAALVVGAVGGSWAADRQARTATAAALAAGTRVVLVVDPPGGGRDLGAPAPVGDDLIEVTLSLTGPADTPPVTVRALRTRIGELALFPALRLRAGDQARATALRGRLDCAAAREAGSWDGDLLRDAAVLVDTGDRPVGLLVANPEQPVPAVLARCTAAEGDRPPP